MRIETVLGPVDPREWGPTAIHEHVFIDLSTLKQDPDACLTDPDLVAPEVAGFVSAGGHAMVDVSSHGMGRNVNGLAEVSRRTGCRLVAATGFYHGPWLPRLVYAAEPAALADLMVRELTEGMDGTAMRAGIIAEIGTSLNEVLPAEAKVFQAAALAQRRTGCPLMTHCTLGTMAREQVAMLLGAGVDPGRVSISHLDLVDDVHYHVEVARTGVFIQYDTIGKESYQRDSVRLRLVLDLLERGWARSLMLACDITRPSYLRSRGGHGYQHLLTGFVPHLRQAGVDEVTLHTLLVDNPRRFLAY